LKQSQIVRGEDGHPYPVCELCGSSGRLPVDLEPSGASQGDLGFDQELPARILHFRSNDRAAGPDPDERLARSTTERTHCRDDPDGFENRCLSRSVRTLDHSDIPCRHEFCRLEAPEVVEPEMFERHL
jgi:hypothetical protein